MRSEQSIAGDLCGELLSLNDFLEMAQVRADSSGDGKLITLMGAAMPRLRRAMEIAEGMGNAGGQPGAHQGSNLEHIATRPGDLVNAVDAAVVPAG